MTGFRPIPLPIHAALRMATGFLTMVAPFLFGFQVPATITAIVVGSVVVGLSLAATPDERNRTPLPVAAVHALDWATVIGLMGAAVVVAFDGDRSAGIVLTAIASTQAAGNLLTRYSLTR